MRASPLPQSSPRPNPPNDRPSIDPAATVLAIEAPDFDRGERRTGEDEVHDAAGERRRERSDVGEDDGSDHLPKTLVFDW